MSIPQINSAISQQVMGQAQSNAAQKPQSNSNNLFELLLNETNKDQITSDTAIKDFIERKPGSSIQQVVMAVAEAEMSFQFFMEIRNQMIDSYNELMRMQF